MREYFDRAFAWLFELAVASGLFDIWATHFQPKLEPLAQKIIDQFDAKLAVAVCSLLVSLYFNWKKTDRKIFERLESLISEEQKRLSFARADLLSQVVRPGPLSAADKPIFSMEPITRVLNYRGWGSAVVFAGSRPMKIDRELQDARTALKRVQALFRTADRRHRLERSTIALLRGAVALSRIPHAKTPGRQSALRSEAIGHLDEVLRIPGYSRDRDALEFRGLALLAGKEYASARDTFETLVDVAGEPNAESSAGFGLARAHYLWALTTIKWFDATQGEQGSLNTANARLIVACEALPGGSYSGRDLLDVARVHQLQASARFRINFPVVGVASRDEALRHYEKLRQDNLTKRRTFYWRRANRIIARDQERERKYLLGEADTGLASTAKLGKPSAVSP